VTTCNRVRWHGIPAALGWRPGGTHDDLVVCLSRRLLLLAVRPELLPPTSSSGLPQRLRCRPAAPSAGVSPEAAASGHHSELLLLLLQVRSLLPISCCVVKVKHLRLRMFLLRMHSLVLC
jgi:hypothetical protein